MTNQERLEAIDTFYHDVCRPILEAKGAVSGAGKDNPNGNFDAAACIEAGHTKFHVWWYLFFKQVWRLKTWIFFGVNLPEGIKETLADIINYAFILWTMTLEDKK